MAILKNENVRYKPVIPAYLQKLYEKISVMKSYGQVIIAVDLKKGSLVTQLAEALNDKLNVLTEQAYNHSPSHEELELFKINFKEQLQSYDFVMEAHKDTWKPIVGNILLALNSVDALNEQYKNSKITHNKYLFFAKPFNNRPTETMEPKLENTSMPAF